MSDVTPAGQPYGQDPVAPGWLLVVAVGVAGAVLGYLLGVAGTTSDGPIGGGETTSTEAAETTQATTTTEAPGDLQPTATDDIGGPCVPGAARARIDEQLERIIARYNSGDARGLVGLIGDGAVIDPTLTPGATTRFESLGAWVEAAGSVGDRLTVRGFGMYEPFTLMVIRENDALGAVGIDRLAVTLLLWVNPDCEVRVEAQHPVSAPDPCRFVVLFAPSTEPGCEGPFEPRTSHVAVWSGTELLIFGGHSGAADAPPLTSGLVFDRQANTWRSMAPAPIPLESWSMKAVWVDDRMVVAGRTTFVEGSPSPVVLLIYDPGSDTWQVSSAMPVDRRAVGGLVWTGSEIILAGGDSNYPDATAWSFSLSSHEWRRLSDPPLPLVEGLEGVWTGDEAIFIGGYVFLGQTPTVAYNPTSGTWRELSPLPRRHVRFHDVLWTGSEVIVFSGRSGLSAESVVFRYSPVTDTWSESQPMPIPSRGGRAGAWTGTKLVLWGGLASDEDFTHGDGALYDPALDTWTVMSPSPLTERCDHTGTWIREGFLVFGGFPSCGHRFAIPDGHAALYDPATDAWTELRPDDT